MSAITRRLRYENEKLAAALCILQQRITPGDDMNEPTLKTIDRKMDRLLREYSSIREALVMLAEKVANSHSAPQVILGNGTDDTEKANRR
jgi:hypothetical protein